MEAVESELEIGKERLQRCLEKLSQGKARSGHLQTGDEAGKSREGWGLGNTEFKIILFGKFQLNTSASCRWCFCFSFFPPRFKQDMHESVYTVTSSDSKRSNKRQINAVKYQLTKNQLWSLLLHSPPPLPISPRFTGCEQYPFHCGISDHYVLWPSSTRMRFPLHIKLKLKVFKEMLLSWWLGW